MYIMEGMQAQMIDWSLTGSTTFLLVIQMRFTLTPYRCAVHCRTSCSAFLTSPQCIPVSVSGENAAKIGRASNSGPESSTSTVIQALLGSKSEASVQMRNVDVSFMFKRKEAIMPWLMDGCTPKPLRRQVVM